MEKRNIRQAKENQGTFPAYAFDLDDTRRSLKRTLQTPAVLHVSRNRTAGKHADRRGHQRYAAANGAFALVRSAAAAISGINKMNIGEIAFAVMRLNPDRLGQIINVSMGGLLFQYTQATRTAGKPSRLDILLADRRFYLDSLKFEMVTDDACPAECGFDSVKTRLFSVRFKDLTAQQKQQLNHFLQNYTLILR